MLTQCQFFPACYQWATFGICAILQRLFGTIKRQLQKDPNSICNPYLVEMTGALERALVYATTGSGRALHRATMGPLLLTQGILRTGFPALHKKIWRQKGQDWGMWGAYWPEEHVANTLVPASSVFAGLRYHYNEEAANVRPFASFCNCKGTDIAQIHLANLQIEHLELTNLGNSEPFSSLNIADGQMLYAMHVLSIPLRFYLEDVKNAVKSGVEQSIAGADMRVQKKRLRTWLKNATLNSFSYSADHFRHLLAIVHGQNLNSVNVADGLPPGRTNSHKTTYGEIATLMVNMSREERPARAGAPFFQNGVAKTMMKTAISALKHKLSQQLGAGVYGWIVRVLAKTLEFYKFKFIPWKVANSAEHYAKWNSWAMINGIGNLPNERLEPEQANPSNMDVEDALTRAIASMQADDPLSEWTVDTLLLQDLDKIVKKMNLPKLDHPYDRLDLNNQLNSYGYQNYLWVWEHYNPTKPIHRVAVVASLILAKLTPYLGFNKDEAKRLLPSKLKSASKPADVKKAVTETRKAVSLLEWLENSKVNRNGINKLACGFIALAIGLAEDYSPLRREMARNGNALGAGWNSKHSKWSCQVPPAALEIIHMIGAGTKGVTPFNLYRAKFFEGLIQPHNPFFNKHYSLKSQQDYADHWADIQRIISEDSPYRMFRLVESLLNVQAAEILADFGEFPRRPNLPQRKRTNTVLSQLEQEASSSKRGRHSNPYLVADSEEED